MPKARDPAAELAALKYEEALGELESLVRTLEGGQLSLEASLDAYRRGALLLGHCQKQLDDADERLRVLEDDQLKALSLAPSKNA